MKAIIIFGQLSEPRKEIREATKQILTLTYTENLQTYRLHSVLSVFSKKGGSLIPRPYIIHTLLYTINVYGYIGRNETGYVIL